MGSKELVMPNGIGFGDEVLNKYDEAAAYTPADVSGAGLSFTVGASHYDRIGKMIYAYGDVTFPVTASVLAAAISIPIPASGNGNGVVGYNTYGALTVNIAASSDLIQLYSTTGTLLTNANLSGKRVVYTAIYRAD